MTRRHILFGRLLGAGVATLALWAVPLAGWAQAAAPAPLKVLRISFPAPETGFDPVQVSDAYSHAAISHIFESLYSYDHLARPFKIRPSTAAALPEVSDDFLTYTIRLKPGILFADDPAFKGRPRELVAEDFIYTLKRYFDPKTKSPGVSNWEEEGILGLDALRNEALKSKTDFNYDRPIAGLKALDRHTLQIKLAQPRPRLLYKLADMPLMAREVVETYGEHIMEHPVGTGPYKLTQWRRSSLMVFDRNPTYREVRYDAEPNADDAEGQALLQRLKGRRLPMIDRVEVGVVEQGQPRWLAFLNGEFDLLGVPLEFATVAAPKGKLAPNLEKRGIRMYRVLAPDVTMVYFNMEDPVVGGYTPDKVALRRAISLGINVEREIRLTRRGQAIPAQAGVPPHTYGFDPGYKSENSEYNVPKAQALLDLYGYIDRDGDGWRDLPDGKPLVLDYATQPDAISREFDELWAKNMDTLRIRLAYKIGKWPEQLKQSRAGKLMLWQLGSTATSPDGQGALELAYGPSAGAGNLARFKLPAFDEIYRKINDAPDGPERQALFIQANKLITAYMPYKFLVHRIGMDLVHPWVVGYRRPIFWRDSWQYMDLEPKTD